MPDTQIRTVLFDLDGTLADTAPDLAAALNHVLHEAGKPTLPFEAIRPVASHGGMALIKLGFQLAPEHPQFEPLREQLLQHYAANIVQHTSLFPGMTELLDRLEARGMRWGVVTNKPGWLTEPLLEGLGIRSRAACVVSGDTLPQRKPDPTPLLYACEQSNTDTLQCLYVGDAERDIIAGKRAGMRTLVALFGYLSGEDRPDEWAADGMIQTPLEILDWIDTRNRVST